MARIMTRDQISGRIWKITLLLTICTYVTPASAKQPSGFMSIDCGSATPYQDSNTSLTWETDEKYIQTGKNGVVPRQASPFILGHDNYEALRTFRYFPERRNKYCYELPLAAGNISILIRAMFLHQNASGLELPTTFSVYVNGTLWASLMFDLDFENLEFVKVIEGIFYSPGKMTYLCLVPDHGVPFISSLELRQLDPEGIMYNFNGRERLLLSIIERTDLGASNQGLPVRYPDDDYDRLWNTYVPFDYYFFNNRSISSRENTSTANPKSNNVPPRVMMDAEVALYQVAPDDTRQLSTPAGSYVCAIFYFQAFSSTEGLNMVISLNGEASAPFNVTQSPVAKTFAHLIPMEYGIEVNLFSQSGFGAIVNALETYEEILIDTSATVAEDARYIEFVKKTFNLSYWQGDPCVPLAYDGITCISNPEDEFFSALDDRLNIRSLYLSNLTDTTKLHNSAYLKDSPTLYYLNNLSITYSDVGDATLQFLLENLATRHSNFYMNLSDNQVRGDIPGGLYSYMENISYTTTMILDRNNITGVLNLTGWYQKLEEAISRNTSSTRTYVLQDVPVLSLVDNDISAIIPSTDDFQPLVEFLMKNSSVFNQSGVLLAGNPYCNDAKSLTQRFICRATINDIVHVYEKPNNKKKIIIIAFSALGGVILLCLTCTIFIQFWRLRQRLLVTSKLLQEIQGVLMKRQKHAGMSGKLASKEVHPLFYSYQDLKVATRNFHEDNRLGSGAFGDVYKGKLSDGNTVAVKRLFNANKKQVLAEFLSEVMLISGINHKHLIQLKGCCIEDEERILIYDFAANGNLAEALWGKHKAPIWDWTHRLNVAVGVARGLSYLHEELQPRIIHRDIKAVNVLLDDNLNAKIADFGLARHFAEEETRAQFTAVAGTRGYFAPEYVLEGQLTTKADVFSYGILLLEIVSGRKCIDSTLPAEHVYIKNWAEDSQKSGSLLELLQPGLRDSAPESDCITIINIALSCIQMNPKFRPTMSQVVIMLLGTPEVQNFLKERGTSHNEDDRTIDSGRSNYRPEKSEIYEDSEEVPFMRSQSQSLRFDASRSSSLAVLELSSISGQ